MPRPPSIEKTIDNLIIQIFHDPRFNHDTIIRLTKLITEMARIIREELAKN